MASPSIAPSLQILLAHSEWVRALARALVADSSVADDVVQETWLKVMERPPRSITNARGWLAAVLRSVVRDRARGESRRAKREQAVAREEAVAASDRLVAEAEMGRTLTGHVLALDEVYRTVLLQRFWSGMDPSEIARARGIPVATVKTQLARGLEKLRSRLQESHGGGPRSWVGALLPLARGEGPVANLSYAGTAARKLGFSAAALFALLSLGVFLLVRGLRASSEILSLSALNAGVESAVPQGDGRKVERAGLAGAPSSSRKPIASPDEPPPVPDKGTSGAQRVPAPVTILGEGLFDPLSDGPRAIALHPDGSLIAFEYGEKGQCQVFDRSGTVRSGKQGVGYCSEAVRFGDWIFLTMPGGRLVKFNALTLENEGGAPINDKGGAWLCNALCVTNGVIHVGSGDPGRIYMFDLNMQPLGSWDSFGLMYAMDAAGQRIVLVETDQLDAKSHQRTPKVRAFQVHGTDPPTSIGEALSLSSTAVDLCALDEARVLIVLEDGHVLQYRCEAERAAGEQWTLEGQANLGAEAWFAPSNGISRAVYDAQRELLYLSFREPHGRVVAVPYSDQNAQRVLVPR